MRGCHQLAHRKETCLQTTDIVLVKLLYALDHIINVLHRLLHKYIFLLALNTFLRLGEVVVKFNQVQGSAIAFEFKQGNLNSVTITLKHNKTTIHLVICLNYSKD